MGNKQKIFILDDNSKALETYSQKLEKKGYSKIICCEDGEKFLKILPYSNIDVIISYIYLPKVGGKGLINKIKKAKEASSMKIIIVSGVPKGNTRWLTKADAFIEKKHFPLVYNLLAKYEEKQLVMENRFFKRFKVHRVMNIDPDTSGIDSIHDISLSGIGFESKFAFEPGEKFFVHAKSWAEKAYHSIVGNIVWRKNHENRYRYGLRFEKSFMPK
jgi:CheY-like chemotaxis protein